MSIKILGISILRNEESFCALAIENALALCDELLILDNNSTDRTHEICVKMTNRHQGRVRLETIDDLALSHEFVRCHAGKDTWIFGVDGDEIYDPNGLGDLRARIMDGMYQDLWRVRSHFYNIAALAKKAGYIYVAAGYI